MNLIQPRTDIALVLMIAGVVLAATFGWNYGIAVGAIGFAAAAYSILRGGSPGKLMIAALVLLSLGSLWFQATSSGQDDPPGLDSVAGFAEEYRAALAETDLEAYRDIAEPVLGDTLEEAFAVEAQCLDWRLAQVDIAEHGVSPFFVVVTFSVDDTNLVRMFEYQSDEWTPTVEAAC